MRSAVGRAYTRCSQLPRVLAGLLVPVLLLSACTDQGSPATTPATTVGPYAVTTRPESTTTTLDRLAEVEAILLDLQTQWTRAMATGDSETIKRLHYTKKLGEMEAELAESPPFSIRDPNGRLVVSVVSLIKDEPLCIVIDSQVDASAIFEGDQPEIIRFVLQRDEPHTPWLLSYRGTGYECEGAHPFE